MPVNWSLLNPSLPAQAQTINPFAAFQAGREQAEQRIQNQQAGELRGAQIDAAKRTAEQEARKQQVRQVLAQWREASEKGDQTTAAAALQAAKGLDLAQVQETVAEIEKEEIEGQTRETQLRTQRLAEADRNAPLVIAAAAAEDKTPGAGKAMMQAAGVWNEEVHGPIWGDRATRARMVQAAENTPSIREQRAKDEKAKRDADADAERLRLDRLRTGAYVTNQNRGPIQRPSQTEEDMARYDEIARIPEGRRTGAQKLFMQKFERTAQGEPSGADMFMGMTAQADSTARKLLGADPDLEDFASDAGARQIFWAAFVRAQREGRMSPTQAAAAAKVEVMSAVRETERLGGILPEGILPPKREFVPTGGAQPVLNWEDL